MKETLYVAGKLKSSDGLAVAIVGSRKMTAEGKKNAYKFSYFLAREGFTIVSGLARGIDTVAHKAALAAGGRTIAVLGSGIDIIYPPENAALAAEIVKSGALVSPFAMGVAPLPKNFLTRNKVVAELSQGVLVIEGKARSGTLSTASHAANLGKDVFVILGSEATDWLAGEGAIVVEEPVDIIEYLKS